MTDLPTPRNSQTNTRALQDFYYMHATVKANAKDVHYACPTYAQEFSNEYESFARFLNILATVKANAEDVHCGNCYEQCLDGCS